MCKSLKVKTASSFPPFGLTTDCFESRRRRELFLGVGVLDRFRNRVLLGQRCSTPHPGTGLPFTGLSGVENDCCRDTTIIFGPRRVTDNFRHFALSDFLLNGSWQHALDLIIHNTTFTSTVKCKKESFYGIIFGI